MKKKIYCIFIFCICASYSVSFSQTVPCEIDTVTVSGYYVVVSTKKAIKEITKQPHA